MLFAKIKDLNLRLKFSKFELKKKIDKYVKINVLTRSFMLKKVQKKRAYILKSLYKDSFTKHSKVKITQRCILTNRSRGVYRSHLISRNIFRDLLQFGIIPGYKKAVW